MDTMGAVKVGDSLQQDLNSQAAHVTGAPRLSGKKDRDNDGAADFQTAGAPHYSGKKDRDGDGEDDYTAGGFKHLSGVKPKND